MALNACAYIHFIVIHFVTKTVDQKSSKPHKRVYFFFFKVLTQAIKETSTYIATADECFTMHHENRACTKRR